MPGKHKKRRDKDKCVLCIWKGSEKANPVWDFARTSLNIKSNDRE